MAFFNEFPFTRNYDADLGWLIRTVKKLMQKFERCPTWYGEWIPEIEYPALAFVEYGSEGSVYMSLQPVPANTPITDAKYWMLTGATMEQILELQRRMAAAEESIETIIDRLGSTSVLVVSDSYGATTDSRGRTSAAIFAEYTGIPTHLCSQGGASFQQGTLLQALQAYSTAHDSEIGTILIYCGANDCGAASTAVIQGIKNFIYYAKTRFTNCRRIVLCCCGLTFGETNGGTIARSRLVRDYVRAAAQCGIDYCLNSEYVLHNTQLLQADLCHPNSDGVNRLAEMLVAAYTTGADDVHYEIDITASLATETTTSDKLLPSGSVLQIGTSLTMKLDNGLVTIESPNFYTIMQIALGEVGDFGGSYCVLNLSDTLVQHDIVNARQCFSLSGIVFQQGGVERYCEFNTSIATKKMYFAVTGRFNAAMIPNATGFTITQAGAVMPSN